MSGPAVATTSFATTGTTVTSESPTTGSPPLGEEYVADFSRASGYLYRDATATDRLTDVTVSAWLYMAGSRYSDSFIFHNGRWTTDGFGVLVRSAPTNRVAMFYPPSTVAPSGYSMPQGRWVYLSVVSTSQDVWRLYDLGTEVAVMQMPSSPRAPSPKFSVLGNGQGMFNNFDGKVAHLTVWDKQRTADELVQDSEFGWVTGREHRLSLFLPFTEGSGTIVNPEGSRAYLGPMLTAGTFKWEPWFGVGTSGTSGLLPATTSPATTSPATTSAAPPEYFAVDFIGRTGQLFLLAAATTRTTQVSMSCWLYLYAVAYPDQNVIHNGRPTADGYGIAVMGSTAALSISYGGVSLYPTSYVVPTGRWVYVSAVSSTSSSWSVYENGVLQATRSVSVSPRTPQQRFYVAGNGMNPINNFNGMLDMVAVWDSVRTSSQLVADSNGLTGYEPGVALYVPFSEGAGVDIRPAGQKAYYGVFNVTGTFRWAERSLE
eukprot:TRINITY_DN1736_c0_g1_i5.p1 TRINITY_DN1736_c0_g1~~TRINITY_DN1736_c0_g1_i5.p1  ORF type:complete len:487 (-),score=100.58 TRINITY_DN1736_c0_g1_i5:196-1656(-)